eukprot:10683188-Heterocapsa_arctica.AAC.1
MGHTGQQLQRRWGRRLPSQTPHLAAAAFGTAWLIWPPRWDLSRRRAPDYPRQCTAAAGFLGVF